MSNFILRHLTAIWLTCAAGIAGCIVTDVIVLGFLR